MPGYILHLTAARMYLESIYSDDALCRDPQQQNDFYIGNLLPDSVKGYEAKAVSHFRDPAYRECMMEWPHPERFCQKICGQDERGRWGCVPGLSVSPLH